MKYKIALDEKLLIVTDLPKSQINKIKEIEKLNIEINEIELEEIDDETQEEFDKMKSLVAQADEELYNFILKFDLEKSIKRREVLANMREKKKKKSLQNNETTIESVATPVKEIITEKVEEVPKVEVPKVDKDLEKLQANAEVYPEQFESEFESDYEPEVEEVDAEEFEKVGNSKPRKLNLPLVIMGVGALLLTWGAVNFFKNKE